MQASDDESEDEDYAGSEDEEGEEESELQGNEGLVDDAAEEDEDEDDEEEVEPGTEGVAETQLDELDDAPAATKHAFSSSKHQGRLRQGACPFACPLGDRDRIGIGSHPAAR